MLWYRVYHRLGIQRWKNHTKMDRAKEDRFLAQICNFSKIVLLVTMFQPYPRRLDESSECRLVVAARCLTCFLDLGICYQTKLKNK